MREGRQGGGGSGYDFATVLLDAPADKVYATALDIARKNTAVRVVQAVLRICKEMGKHCQVGG
jgi:hypothetical protein